MLSRRQTYTKSRPIISETNMPLRHLLKIAGYIHLKYIAQTSQGSIHNVASISTQNKGDTYAIKVTEKTLNDQSVTQPIGTITHEDYILRYLSSSNKPSPPALIKYKDFFCDKYNYYLLTEDIGESMFNIVTKCHQLIRNKRLDIDEWHTFCRIAMRQMVDVLEWMHNTMHCCHLNVSLESFFIKNMNIMITPSTGKVQICPDFQVKLSNFAIAEVFESTNDDGQIDFNCNKYAGKILYQAPEVYDRRNTFDGRSADCWALSVCFFIMFTGSSPFQRASAADALFNYMMNDQMMDVLKSWNMSHYVPPEVCDILRRLFVEENDRLTMIEIKQHCWYNQDNIK